MSSPTSLSSAPGRFVQPALRRTGTAQAPVRRLVSVLALVGIPASLLGIAVARGGLANPWVYPLLGITLMANVMVVLMDIRYGLALFILTAGMSPKLPGVYNNLRVEDFIFFFVFAVWFTRALQSGNVPRLRNPMVLPFAVLTAMSVLSTVWGITIGTVPDVKYSVFLQLKRVEYFLIFWVVASTIRSEGWLRAFVLTLAASGALAGVYGLAHPADSYNQTVAATRVTGAEGENYNTFSGFLVICISAGLSAIGAFPKGRTRLFLIVCTLISTTALLMSFSREGYIMLVGSLLVFGITRNRGILIASFLGLGIILVAVPPVRQNFQNAITQIQNAQTDDPGTNSLTARYASWNYRWNLWFLKQPLLGNGVGSVQLSVDNEYLLRLCEVGIVGTLFFVWWLVSIGRQIKGLQRTRGLPRTLGSGLAGAFVGMLIQATVASSFNTIRTMEPFWFLLGMASAAVAIHRDLAQQQAANFETK